MKSNNFKKASVELTSISFEYGSWSQGSGILNNNDGSLEITHEGEDSGNYLRSFERLLKEKFGEGPYKLKDLRDDSISQSLSSEYSEDSRSTGIIVVRVSEIN